MAAIQSFGDSTLEQISNVLGDMDSGLTNREIEKYLASCNISDPGIGANKRSRLLEALRQKQNQDQCANNICAFIERAMAPVLYVKKLDSFQIRRDELNQVLAFEGLSLSEQGKLGIITPVKTISQAQSVADSLRAELTRRSVHSDVLKFCRAELIQKNCFHAVLEAAKSVAQKIRDKSGLISDGAELVDEAFGIGKKPYPILAFNSLQTESDKSEHTGLMNLMKGFFGTFRNPPAHAPKIFWNISEQDAMDMMTVASLLHRRLDTVVKTTS